VRSNRDNTASWARKAFSSKSAKNGLTPKVCCSQLQCVFATVTVQSGICNSCHILLSAGEAHHRVYSWRRHAF
jgi:hypothetical protein